MRLLYEDNMQLKIKILPIAFLIQTVYNVVNKVK